MDKNTIKNSANTSVSSGNGKMTVYNLIEKQKSGFASALPKGFDAERFTRIAITTLKQNPKLRECEPYSVLGALMSSAQLGLEPNSPLHEASLIPYKGRASFQIEYRGLLKLVWNSGMLSRFDYDKICENDHFKHTKGYNGVFEHEPVLRGERGDAYAYYALAELKNGGRAEVVKTIDEIKKHAARFSKAYGDRFKDSPWQTDFDSMAIKTVIKELCDKKLPKRTNNEALDFAKATGMDGKIVTMTEDQVGKDIKVEDLVTEDTEFSDVEEVESDNPELFQYPVYFEKIINEAKTKKEYNEILTKHKTDIEMFEGKAKEMIDKAITEKSKELNAKK